MNRKCEYCGKLDDEAVQCEECGQWVCEEHCHEFIRDDDMGSIGYSCPICKDKV